MSTPTLYLGLVLAVACERLVELRLSKRNSRRLRQRGAVEEGASHYPAMVVIHTLFLIACPLEVYLLDRPFVPALGYPMLALLLAAMSIRYWVVATLGDRWTTRVLWLPGAAPIASGPYRFARHPNYVAVVLELLALPLIHGAWIVAVAFGAANGVILWVRIRVEVAALRRHGPPVPSPPAARARDA